MHYRFQAQDILFEKLTSPANNPTLCSRFHYTSAGFSLMFWKFFHTAIVLIWLKQVDFTSNQQTEEKRFRNSVFVYVWMNTRRIISKYELMQKCVYVCVFDPFKGMC